MRRVGRLRLTLGLPPCNRAGSQRNEDRRRGYQTDLSAEPARAQTAPRLPLAHGDQGWPEGALAPPRQGPQAALCLSPTVPKAPERLRKRAEFQFVQKGARRGQGILAAQARRREPVDQNPPRVGFTATKKIGNSVARNRARRRLREAARRLVPLYGLPGVDYVFLARESTGQAPWERLLDDMKDALLRLAAALPPPT